MPHNGTVRKRGTGSNFAAFCETSCLYPFARSESYCLKSTTHYTSVAHALLDPQAGLRAGIDRDFRGSDPFRAFSTPLVANRAPSIACLTQPRAESTICYACCTDFLSAPFSS